MKRKSSDKHELPARDRLNKRARENAPPTFQETTSIRKQAESHRITVAKMPLDALTCRWSNGSNRQLKNSHVQKLCGLFMEGKLARQSTENYILVQCSGQSIQRAISKAMLSSGNDNEENGGEDVESREMLRFDDWMVVNDEKAEVMAGQHRIEALREYVKQTKGDAKDLWWVCEFYNKDSLPPDISLKLRLNRRNLALADCHGQVWSQLILASGWDETLFSGKKSKVEMEENMRDILSLSNEIQLPIGRLVTLWRNKRWKPMITQWCETAVGKETFNISLWENIASRRFDDYFFTKFNQVLETLGTLPGDAGSMVQAADWEKLSQKLRPGYLTAQVRELFFPDQPQVRVSEGYIASATTETARRPGFLSVLGGHAYDQVYRHIIKNSNLRFPDIHQFLKLTKEETQIMAQVLTHVVGWLNAQPTEVVWKQENTKPLLRKDMVPILQAYAPVTALGTDSDDDLGDGNGATRSTLPSSQASSAGDGDSRAAAWAEDLSIVLERRVLDFVRENMATFKDPSNKFYLWLMPDQSNKGYKSRFTEDRLWRDLYHLVKEVIGCRQFRATWESSTFLDDQANRDNGDNHKSISAITRAICSHLKDIPWISENPALKGENAYIALAAIIDQPVLEWAARQCQCALDNKSSANGVSLSSEEIQLIKSAHEKYKTCLKDLHQDLSGSHCITDALQPLLTGRPRQIKNTSTNSRRTSI